MSENPEQKTSPEKKETVVDLSSLADLNFGPRWSSGSTTKVREFKEHREERRDHAGGGHQKPRNRRPDSFKKGGRSDFGRDQQVRAPRVPRPQFYVDFYPEDEPFNALVRAMKSNCKTYELFELARLILEKEDRFVAVVGHKQDPRNPQEKKLVYFSVQDSIPFSSEEEALGHAFKHYLDKFYEVEEIEVEAPKGNFTVVNKCGFTGELLGPPNYHRYPEFLQEHYANNLSHISYERFQERIEGVKDEEQIKSWLDKMTKIKKYKLKGSSEGEEPKVFESKIAAQKYLIEHRKKELVNAKEHVRFSGIKLKDMPAGPIKEAATQELARLREFPLDAANNLRGRLRRLKFSLFKQGSRGVTYVCAVKRKYREAGVKSLADNLEKLVEFIEKNQKLTVLSLSNAYLGIQASSVKTQKNTADKDLVEEQNAPLTDVDQSKVRQLMLDLRWLVSEGYVTEYGNGALFAPAPIETKKHEPKPSLDKEKTAGESIVSESGPSEDVVATEVDSTEVSNEEKEDTPESSS